MGDKSGKGGGRSSSRMIRCNAVSSFGGETVFTLTDLLNKTRPPAVLFSFSKLDPLLASPTLNLRSSGDSLLALEGIRRTGRRTTGTAESGMRRRCCNRETREYVPCDRGDRETREYAPCYRGEQRGTAGAGHPSRLM